MSTRPRLAKGLALPPGIFSTAVYSEDRLYRYALIRYKEGCGQQDSVAFVMLNPSCATEEVDDRTLAKCWRLTNHWGYSVMRIANVYALRATDPRDLWKARDPVGPKNDAALQAACGAAKLVVCAWSSIAHPYRVARVKEILRASAGQRCAYLQLNKDGQPSHPLYLRESIQPTMWELT